MPQFLISDEIRKLVIKDCIKRFSKIKDCGIFVNVCGSDKCPPHKIYVIASYFATTENNKQKLIIMDDKEILDKISLLYERTNKKNGTKCLLFATLKQTNFLLNFLTLIIL